MPIPSRLLTRPASAWVLLAVIATLAYVPPADAQQSAHAMYTRALARERQLRNAANSPTLAQIRSVVAAYENVVRRYPRSGYSDNGLWQGGNLAALAFERFGQAADKRTALRLLQQLRSEYPSSSLIARVAEAVRQLEAPPRTVASKPAPAASRVPPASRAAPPPVANALDEQPVPPAAAPAAPAAAHAAPTADAPPEAASTSGGGEPASAPPAGGQLVTIRDIRRTDLPDGVRVSIEMDGEAMYRSERLENPSRVFFDLQGTRTVLSLQDATIRFGEDLVREVRVGRHPQNTTRIVMDLAEVDQFSVFTLYNPFRLIVDFHRERASRPAPAVAGGEPGGRPEAPARGAAPAPRAAVVEAPVRPVTRTTPPPVVAPAAPAANANGQFSIARQLGLGVSRIVLDAGHGGHDPGARAHGISEAELVLDVTLRLRALLQKQPGFEVTLTRDKDVFIPLEERTAIANRKGADLFLSIHANASRNTSARGIETYFLNFASNREAEAVAARENSASGRTMHNLPDIVRAIALNNKIDESRDFAAMVQQSMVRGLSARNKEVRDLGVKQAPFVVLIGASMPSILAEISFVTHRQEAALLKSPAYRQQIAQALLDGILRYQRSLKGVRTVAARE